MSKKKSNSVAEAPGGELPDGTPYQDATMVADGNVDQSAADRHPEYMPCVRCSTRSQDGDSDHLCDHCRQEEAAKSQGGNGEPGERRKVSRPRTNPVQFYVCRLSPEGLPPVLVVQTKSVRSANRKADEYSRVLNVPRELIAVVRVKFALAS